jgi:hypothetical protein
MTRSVALALLKEYQDCARRWPACSVLHTIYDRFPLDTGGGRKAMRELGFAQGVLYAHRKFTLDDLKLHSRRGYVWTRHTANRGAR